MNDEAVKSRAIASAVPSGQQVSRVVWLFDTGFGVVSHGVESSALGLLYEKSVLAVALFSMIFQFATIPLIFVANQLGKQ